MFRYVIATAFVSAGLAAAPAHAAFTTVNLDGYVNTNVIINPSTLPIGTSTGNQGTDIPFRVSSSPYSTSYSGVWLSDGGVGTSLTVDLTGLNISAQSSFYALLNNYYGTPGADEYDITIASANHSVTYQSIGGVDTRDYNANAYTNTVAATTTEWFNNGMGQRYDVRTFSLPGYFGDETINSFKITQVHGGDNVIFAGLTFSTLAAGAVPEPASWAMMVGGFGLVGGALRSRKKAAATFA